SRTRGVADLNTVSWPVHPLVEPDALRPLPGGLSSSSARLFNVSSLHVARGGGDRQLPALDRRPPEVHLAPGIGPRSGLASVPSTPPSKLHAASPSGSGHGLTH